MLAFNGFAQSDGVDYSLEGLAKAFDSYDFISSFHEGLARVGKDNKQGFINKKGELVIPCKYSHVDDFSEGLASVSLDRKGEDSYITERGYIDKNGTMVLNLNSKYLSVNNFHEGLAAVRELQVDKKSGYTKERNGFINKKGQVVIPCKYIYVGDFSEGLAIVNTSSSSSDESYNQNYGYFDTNGNMALRITNYSGVNDFHDGLAMVWKEQGHGYIDKSGREVIPCTYADAKDFSEGLARIKILGEGYRYINKRGQEVLKFPDGVYPSKDFHEGLAIVRVEQYDKYAYIDTSFKYVFYYFEEAHSFSEGLALVEKDGKWGFIDKNGKSTFDFISGSKNVEKLKKNVATIDSHKQEVKTNDDMSSCWFVYGKKRELESENVIANDKIADNFNKEYFSEIKKDKKEVFNLYSTAAKVLSNHPSDSYELSKNDKGYYYLRIIDPSSFWTYTNYLVIVVE